MLRSVHILFVLLSVIGCSYVARAQQAAPTVAFTFDDLPAHGPLAPGQQRRDVVNSILATLKREQMPPVYGFVNGFRLKQYPYQIEILQAWQDAGEPLGNHTYAHEAFDTEKLAAFERDVAGNEPILRKVDPSGDWHWFRFPYLEQGETVARRDGALDYLHQHGYRVAEVSMDFEDWAWDDTYGRCAATHDEPSIKFLHDSYLAAADQSIISYRGLSQKLLGRDIAYVLLLHVGSFDARMMPELIALFRQRGFQFVTLQQAESDPAYATKPANAVKGGGTFLDLLANDHHVPTIPDPEAIPKLDALCR